MHVSACALRYEGIFSRLQRIERILWAGLVILVTGLGTMVIWLADLAAGLAGIN